MQVVRLEGLSVVEVVVVVVVVAAWPETETPSRWLKGELAQLEVDSSMDSTVVSEAVVAAPRGGAGHHLVTVSTDSTANTDKQTSGAEEGFSLHSKCLLQWYRYLVQNRITRVGFRLWLSWLLGIGWAVRRLGHRLSASINCSNN